MFGTSNPGLRTAPVAYRSRLVSRALRSKEMTSSRGEGGIMPQDMVVGNLSDSELSAAVNGNVGLAPSPYNPK